MGDHPSLRQQGNRIGAVLGAAGTASLVLSLVIGPGVVVAQLFSIKQAEDIGATTVAAPGLEHLDWIFLLVAVTFWAFAWRWD